MQRFSKLSISRVAHKTPELARVTGKAQHCAEISFGHDSVTTADDGEKLEVIGNPRFQILNPLEFNIIYRAGYADPRNKAGRASSAEAALGRSKDFEASKRQLQQKYDGLDFANLSVNFVAVILAVKPGYANGESQMLLIPDPEQMETAFLLEEAQICSTGLLKASPRFGAPESPVVPGIPLIRLASDVTPLEKGIFIKELQKNNVLPATLELGGRNTDSHDRVLDT